MQLLHYWDLRDVILVGHSYGGMVITGVADRATDRVGKLVYLDAANPTNGQSLLDVAGPIIEMTRPMGEDGRRRRARAAAGAWRGSVLRRHRHRDLAWMDARLTAHPWKCFEQKLELRNEEALWAIPQYHIVCTSTLATRDPVLMAERASGGPALGHRHRARSHDHRTAPRR